MKEYVLSTDRESFFEGLSDFERSLVLAVEIALDQLRMFDRDPDSFPAEDRDMFEDMRETVKEALAHLKGSGIELVESIAFQDISDVATIRRPGRN